MAELATILNGLSEKQIKGNTEKVISGITYDSRRVKPGFIFVCIRGFKMDGHDFVNDAIAKGAVAIVVEKAMADLPSDITVVKVADTRIALAKLAAEFYRHPSRELLMVGVTGTNGKTTTTHLVEAIFAQAGKKTGLIGTIKNKIGERILQVERTTPESSDLQALLAEMAAEHVEMVTMEVSSHALELGRVIDCEFDVGVFTNITQDHLDFHQTFQAYLDAKVKLFQSLGLSGRKRFGKAAVINLDDPSSPYIISKTPVKVITYSAKSPADVQAKDIRISASGVSFLAETFAGRAKINLHLTGMFNVYNALAAIGVGLANEIDLATIKQALEGVKGVAGRFERVDCGQDFTVIVDYAHTPDGLENILRTATEFAHGRIITVFGCGGDRDRTKRPIMGEIAARMSDYCVITSDNPRSEDPAEILKEIEVGVLRSGKTRDDYTMIVDRTEGIKKAIEMARKDDIIIIAGKGHETYQILKDRTIPFDDREVVRRILRG